ncbi:ribose transport system ATP-binding protein [Sphingomonas jinjuensis]|uniref:Ribose transport system ATP-binding protein n=1 Tax=Sphingomonas jinjuensis TaxID=535907 RepID=A0A840F7D1_9SPHN|nr:sugar ABC transporter ATP-binding protein [Sphingomonas jinjuensis]MBB4152226.1 ribose transport system ATP-binding protein [Sphingomonas jinjuensis]
MPLLSARGVAMRYPNGTVALRGVDLDVPAGRVTALVGANGAGKSTLIRILSGAARPTGGSLEWLGQATAFRRPVDARRAGIATIHQHIPLVPTLSVAENILIDRGGIARTQAGDREAVAALLARLDARIDPDARVGDLGIGDRQAVAIAAALAVDAKLVIMDEPTASLAGHERAAVYRVIRQLADEGRAVLFISHFLDEIVRLSDWVAVLRDGGIVLDAETDALTEADIAGAMAGRQFVALARRERAGMGEPRLTVEGLATPALAEPVNLSVARGEIVGLAGLLGSGRSELLHAIFAADRHATGLVGVDGEPVGRSVEERIAAGIALVAEDRVGQGLVPAFDIRRNVALPVGGGWLVDDEAERAAAARAIETLAIKAQGPETAVAELSGGNAQKVTIARWLRPHTRVLLLDEPTAGIDIGARSEILRLIRGLADEGMAIVVASSDFAELLVLADRVLVLRDKRIIASRDAAGLDEDTLILLAGGSAPQGSAS